MFVIVYGVRVSATFSFSHSPKRAEYLIKFSLVAIFFFIPSIPRFASSISDENKQTMFLILCMVLGLVPLCLRHHVSPLFSSQGQSANMVESCAIQHPLGPEEFS